MEGVTLIESGTNRYHFAFLKKYEACKNALQADDLIISTIAEIESALQIKSVFSSTSSTYQLLLLLHCIDLYPSSPLSERPLPSIQFALVSSLDLAATAEKSKDLWLAYAILGRIFAFQNAEDQLQTSLLVLNTVRQHLEADVKKSEKRRNTSQSNSKPSSRIVGLVKVTLALKSILNGVPLGADIFPALYGPISLLCNHSEDKVQGLALDALGKIYSYLEPDEGLARAIWERTRGVMRVYLQEGRIREGTSLPKALLRAAKRASKYGIISDQQLVDSCLDLASCQNSSNIVINALELCVDAISRGSPSIDQIGRIRSVASILITKSPNDFASLLSGCSILGHFAASEPSPKPEDLKAIWDMIKSHLSAKNANRKVLATRALTAFLPFQWYQAGNSAGLEMSEMEMGLLMDMLGDRDDNVRLQTLSLVWQIDANILESHIRQLVDASQDRGRSREERLRFSHYALEALGVRFSNQIDATTSTNTYANAIYNIMIDSVKQHGIDQDAIRFILSRLRQVKASAAQHFLLSILQSLEAHKSSFNSTLVILCATLSCEFECIGSQGKDILQNLGRLLTKLSDSSSMEAVTIAVIKVMLDLQEINAETMANMERVGDHQSASVRQRVKQFHVLSSHLEDIVKSRNGSLMQIMDWIEKLASRRDLTQGSSSEFSTDFANSSRPIAKPLQYDAYKDQATYSASPTLSYSIKGEFSALPKPSSQLSDDRSRRHRQKLEDELQKEMQKNIARLTLGRNDSEDEVEESLSIQDTKKIDHNAMLI